MCYACLATSRKESQGQKGERNNNGYFVEFDRAAIKLSNKKP